MTKPPCCEVAGSLVRQMRSAFGDCDQRITRSYERSQGHRYERSVRTLRSGLLASLLVTMFLHVASFCTCGATTEYPYGLHGSFLLAFHTPLRCGSNKLSHVKLIQRKPEAKWSKSPTRGWFTRSSNMSWVVLTRCSIIFPSPSLNPSFNPSPWAPRRQAFLAQSPQGGPAGAKTQGCCPS